MAQQFSPDILKPENQLQLFTLLKSMQHSIDTAAQQMAAVQAGLSRQQQQQQQQSRTASHSLTQADYLAIRDALQSSGSAPLNVSALPGILGQSQRGFAVTATSASTLPNPALYEVGTIGAVLASGSLAFYLVAEGTPRTWVAQTSLVLEVVDATFRVVGSSDATKKLAFEVDTLVAAGTTRTMTVPNNDQVLAGRDVNNSFTAVQNVTATIADALLFLRNNSATGFPGIACIDNAGVTKLALVWDNATGHTRYNAVTGNHRFFNAGTLRFEQSSTGFTETGTGTITGLLTLSAAGAALLLSGNPAANTVMMSINPGGGGVVFSVDREGDVICTKINASGAVVFTSTLAAGQTAIESNQPDVLSVNHTAGSSGLRVFGVEEGGSQLFGVFDTGDVEITGDLDVNLTLNVDGTAQIDGALTCSAGITGTGLTASGGGNILGGSLTINGTDILSGSGSPNGSVSGTSGDYYFRTDTPSTANQRIYVCTGGTSWTGIV